MNSKKIVSMIGAAAVAASMAMSSLPVCAAVTTMPDGGKFDAAYYAATYPDVVAALGTNANTLYQHYKTFGAKEGRQPYAAGTAAAATTAQTVSTALTATEKKNAQKILNEYISGKRTWGIMDAYSYGGKVKYTSVAKNPQFAITDLNKDGKVELYTYGAEGWDVYKLQGTPSQYPDMQVTGYNPSTNMYANSFGLDTEVYDANGQGYMSFGWSAMDDKYYAIYSNGVNQIITEAVASTLEASYLPIEQFLQAQPLTKANVNAIK